MRKTLRELLLLLLLGQADPLGTMGSSGGASQPLVYGDLEALRPNVAASSWRGAVMKAQEQQWVLKTRFQGSTAVQLTHQGMERVWDELLMIHPIRTERQQHVWTLGLLQTSGLSKTHSVLQNANAILKSSGAWLVTPGVVVWPHRWYEESVVRQVRQAGAVICCMPVEPEKAVPLSLEAWLVVGQEPTSTLRLLEKSSKDIESLLNNVSVKKELTQQKKQRLGTVWLSGLDSLQAVSWQESLDDQVLTQARQLTNQLTAIAQLFRASLG